MVAFRDYFQMSGEDTRWAFHAFFRAIAANKDLQVEYCLTSHSYIFTNGLLFFFVVVMVVLVAHSAYRLHYYSHPHHLL